MASATAANNTFQMSDEIYDKAKALYEVAVHEGGGSILKDYYTIFEYRDRRAKFFDKLPGWSRRPRDIYEMVKRDSNLFFDEDDPTRQLDALEVRERELEHQFEVLLPLPTTANTQTIDNFKTCPPIDGSREADEESEDEEQIMEDGDHEADEAEDEYDQDVEDGRDVPTPGGSLTHSTPVTSPVMGNNSAFDKKMAILNDPARIVDPSDLATPMLPGLMRSKQRVAAPQPPVPTPTVDGPYTQKTSTSPKNFTVAPGVSAMSRYGMPGPIKSQHRQHTPEQAKMTASKPATASKNSEIIPKITVGIDKTDSAEPVAKKRKVDHVAAKPPAKHVATATISRPATSSNQAHAASSGDPIPTTSQEATNADQAPAFSGGTTKTRISHTASDNNKPTSGSSDIPVATNPHPTVSNNQPATVLSATPTIAATLSTAPAIAPAFAPTTVPAAAQRRLNDIIAGRILPRSKQEAKDAADEQHSRLLAAYRAHHQTQNQSTTRKSARKSTMNANPDPDFMPHYFSAANFPAEEVAEGGSVRCVCGATENDPEKGAIVCEPCQVWQHTDCLYPGMSAEELEEVTHLCTVCDPYAHRHVLRRLRAGETIGGEQKGKVVAKAKGKAKGKSKK
ncbi:hypothetical protein MBLNU13_g02982t2 [Cladosporium sp. NU13]